jgi:hypothetical protein
MRQFWMIALALALVAGGTASNAADDSTLLIPETEIIKALQAAVRADDKQWFAEHLHLPVRYYGKTFRMIRSKEWFLQHYATILGPELKASILAQDPESYLKNYQGLMVGEGSRNIWFADFGDPGAGTPSHYEIITINNSD